MAAAVGTGFPSLKEQLANIVNAECARIFGLERARNRKGFVDGVSIYRTPFVRADYRMFYKLWQN